MAAFARAAPALLGEDGDVRRGVREMLADRLLAGSVDVGYVVSGALALPR